MKMMLLSDVFENDWNQIKLWKQKKLKGPPFVAKRTVPKVDIYWLKQIFENN